MSINKLTAKRVDAMKPKPKQYKVSDGQGMYMQVMPTGAKYWRWTYRHGGKQKTLALGTYPDVSLAAARARLAELRQQLAAGIDPAEERRKARAAKQLTFAEIFEQWHAWKRPDWTDKSAQQTRDRITIHALPVIGSMPLQDITPTTLTAMIDRMTAAGKNETARKVYRIAGRVFDFALMTEQLTTNPASSLAGYIRPTATTHHAAITEPAEVGALIRAIRGYPGDAVTRAALQLLPLVFTRPGELRHARWQDIDTAAAVWAIPAEQTKMRAPLLVPLSRQALAIIVDLRPITGHVDLLFPGMRSRTRPISDVTINAALRRLGYDGTTMTAHGFRAMARTLLDEQLGIRPDFIEQQLGHRVKDPNGRAYNRTRHLDGRAVMMQSWADYLDRLAGEPCN